MERQFKRENQGRLNIKYELYLLCKTGHIHDDYYRLIGFSDDFEFTKQKSYQGSVKANAVRRRRA